MRIAANGPGEICIYLSVEEARELIIDTGELELIIPLDKMNEETDIISVWNSIEKAKEEAWRD